METKFRKYLRSLLRKNGVWSVTIEHRSGGKAGFPDTLVDTRLGLLPVELKVGTWGGDTDKMHCSRIRPAQIKLLDEMQARGIRARLLIGWQYEKPDTDWSIWMLRDVSRKSLMRWRTGFPEADLDLVATEHCLEIHPDQW